MLASVGCSEPVSPLDAATAVVAVIGDPVAHSLSPAIHNAAFDAEGLDWVCVGFRVAPGRLGDAVRGIRGLGVRGVSVTMPHKAAVLDELDELTPTAQSLGAVNCIINDDGHLIGDNTDGEGFLVGLRHDFGLAPAGLECVVIGAGGAARAVVRALAEAGAGSVGVLNRTPERAASAAALAGSQGFVAVDDDVSRADIVVNATPVGMGDDGRVPIDPSLLTAGGTVAELVYHPASTPLMELATARGCATANGVSMLVGQAAVAFEHWTGRGAPLDRMRAGALRAIGISGEN